MRRIAILVIISTFLLSACMTATATLETSIPSVAETPSTPTTGKAALMTATPENTSIPTPTATLVPPPARWYWALEGATGKLLAVNQFGEKREIGSLSEPEQLNSQAFPVDNERALLLTDDEIQLHAYLITPDEMQAITLPTDLGYDSEKSKYSFTLPAVYGDHIVFGYTDQQNYGGSGSIMADRGPLVFIDLQSLTSRVLDGQVNRDIYLSQYDTRHWAHLSQDGRYLRYLDGGEDKMNVRELDLDSGEVRTVKTITGQATSRISAALRGDMWRSVRDNIVFDLDGNQTTFSSDSQTFRPMRDGKAMVYPFDCEENCEIRVVSPFNGESDQVYTLPWSTGLTIHNPLIYLPDPDNNLVFVGAPAFRASAPPAILAEYPAMTEEDAPVFRLAPDGGATILGVYNSGFSQDSTPVSTDGRYMLFGTVDHQSFVIYNLLEDRPVAEMPVLPGLDYFWGNIDFYENGSIAHFLASTEDDTYRDFFLVYSEISGKSYYWENEDEFLAGCLDILEDDTLVCGTYTLESGYQQLVQFNPNTQEFTILLDDIWNLQFVR